MSNNSKPKWISAGELCAAWDGADVSKLEDIVFEAARSGALKARADLVFFLNGVSIARKRKWTIPSSAWRESHAKLDSIRLSLFHGGTLDGDTYSPAELAIEPEPLSIGPDVTSLDFRAHGLTFDMSDIVRLPVFQALELPRNSKRHGGRSPAGGWPIFAAAAAIWVYRSGDLAENLGRKSPGEVLKAVQDIAESEWGEELARSTFQPGIEQLLQRMTDEAKRDKIRTLRDN